LLTSPQRCSRTTDLTTSTNLRAVSDDTGAALSHSTDRRPTGPHRQHKAGAMPACLQCKEEYQPAPRRGARPQAYCGRPCQIKAANARRASTCLGRGSGALRTAKSVLDSSIDLPAISTVPEAPKAVDRLAIAARISALMTLAHSRGGIDPWQIAELAKLKGISPWAPLRVILGHKDGMK
jgi:hypothetical protein